jgi:AGCS family alanine or glycine:cation symporter
MFQVNQSMGAVAQTLPWINDYNWVYGLVLAASVAIVIIGGIKSIARTAERIVPFMCVVYVGGALVILVMHAAQIPAAFATIVAGAFTPEAQYGGFIGVLAMGFRRAAFSNEAGVGSAAIAHSAARTEEPVREGIVALLEPFIDTVVVCTMTALVIVITGAYERPGDFAIQREAGNGAALTSLAFGDTVSWFPYILTVAVILFAYSTMISWSYYGERCWVFLFGEGSSLTYKVVFCVFVFLGSIVSAMNVMEFGDTMILAMAFPNMLGMYFLAPKVKAALDTYLRKLKAGEFQTFG